MTLLKQRVSQPMFFIATNIKNLPCFYGEKARQEYTGMRTEYGCSLPIFLFINDKEFLVQD